MKRLWVKIKANVRHRLIAFLGIADLRRDADIILRSLNVGVDVHLKTDSWAVICMDGNPCYVNFVRLPKDDLRYLKDWLRQFQKANSRIIDSPFGVSDFIGRY